MTEKIAIVGAGLAGSLLATQFARRGFSVDLFEKHPDLRNVETASSGRNIALSISHRGLAGLETIGLRAAVLEEALSKHSRMVHLEDGSRASQRYGKDGQTINTVNRRRLNSLLLDHAEKAGVRIFFEQRCIALDPDVPSIQLLDATGAKSVREYDRVIGADGCFSAVRDLLERRGVVDAVLKKTGFGYREVVIPAGADGEYVLEHDHVHVWPRRNYILVALPQHDRTFCCNLFMPSEGELSLEEIRDEAGVNKLFTRSFPDVVPLVPDLAAQYFRNASSHIFSVECAPWHYRDKVLLIGDAAHAIPPFYAMGMNICFEDCAIISELLDEHACDFKAVFAEFSRLRKPDTDAMAELSYNNFQDITRSPDPDYDLKWKLDRRIWELTPETWTPLYPMIAFSRIPLSEVIDRHHRQSRILSDLVARPEIRAAIDSDTLPGLLEAALCVNI